MATRKKSPAVLSEELRSKKNLERLRKRALPTCSCGRLLSSHQRCSTKPRDYSDGQMPDGLYIPPGWTLSQAQDAVAHRIQQNRWLKLTDDWGRSRAHPPELDG